MTHLTTPKKRRPQVSNRGDIKRGRNPDLWVTNLLREIGLLAHQSNVQRVRDSLPAGKRGPLVDKVGVPQVHRTRAAKKNANAEILDEEDEDEKLTIFEKRPRYFAQVGANDERLPVRTPDEGTGRREEEMNGNFDGAGVRRKEEETTSLPGRLVRRPDERSMTRRSAKEPTIPKQTAHGDMDNVHSPPIKSKDPMLKTRADLQRALDDLAMEVSSLCLEIVQDPELHIERVRCILSLNHRLVRIHAESQSSLEREFCVDGIVLVVQSLGLCFQESCPGYVIRLPTPRESRVQTSKETARIRLFEAALLSCYSDFLEFLELSLGVRRGRQKTQRCIIKPAKDAARVQRICLNTTIRLLQHLLHFNFAERLVGMILQKVSSLETGPLVADALVGVLVAAHSYSGATLRICVSIVRRLSDMIMSAGAGCREHVLAPLLHIPFAALDAAARTDRPSSSGAPPTNGNQTHHRLSRKMRGRMQHASMRKWIEEESNLKSKVQAELERDLKEVEAEATPEESLQAKREMLSATSRAWLSVLRSFGQQLGSVTVGRFRSETGSTKSSIWHSAEHSLPYILRGVSKIAPLVNVDLLGDILNEIRSVLDASALDKSACAAIRLACIRGAFDVLMAQQTAFQNADPSALDAHLYRVLHPIRNPSMCQEPLALETLQTVVRVILGARRVLPSARGAAFVVRLMECASEAHTCRVSLGFLACGTALLDRYPHLQVLLHSESVIRSESKSNTDHDEFCLPMVGVIRSISNSAPEDLESDPDFAGSMTLSQPTSFHTVFNGCFSIADLLTRMENRHDDTAVRTVIRKIRCQQVGQRQPIGIQEWPMTRAHGREPESNAPAIKGT